MVEVEEPIKNDGVNEIPDLQCLVSYINNLHELKDKNIKSTAIYQQIESIIKRDEVSFSRLGASLKTDAASSFIKFFSELIKRSDIESLIIAHAKELDLKKYDEIKGLISNFEFDLEANSKSRLKGYVISEIISDYVEKNSVAYENIREIIAVFKGYLESLDIAKIITKYGKKEGSTATKRLMSVFQCSLKPEDKENIISKQVKGKHNFNDIKDMLVENKTSLGNKFISRFVAGYVQEKDVSTENVKTLMSELVGCFIKAYTPIIILNHFKKENVETKELSSFMSDFRCYFNDNLITESLSIQAAKGGVNNDEVISVLCNNKDKLSPYSIAKVLSIIIAKDEVGVSEVGNSISKFADRLKGYEVHKLLVVQLSKPNFKNDDAKLLLTQFKDLLGSHYITESIKYIIQEKDIGIKDVKSLLSDLKDSLHEGDILSCLREIDANKLQKEGSKHSSKRLEKQRSSYNMPKTLNGSSVSPLSGEKQLPRNHTYSSLSGYYR